jgi:hypothetical protein
MYDDYIETHGRAFGLEALVEFLNVNSRRTLVGAIELSKQDTFFVG